MDVINVPDSFNFKLDYTYSRYLSYGVPNAVHFDFDKIRKHSLNFINSLKVGKKTGLYKYSSSCNTPNIYASAFACIVRNFYGDLDHLSIQEKREWVDYLNSFQSEFDGLYRDPNLQNDIFDTSDWWGARHFMPILISAIKVLGAKPKFKLLYLNNYLKEEELKSWLDNMDWDFHTNDIDNQIMNIGVMLQYARDELGLIKAEQAVSILLELLSQRINKSSGLWGDYNLDCPNHLSRSIQFAYHLYTLFSYDKIDILYPQMILNHVLKTQNEYGGFGVKLNSSACEDIDSVELLIRLAPYCEDYLEIIQNSLAKALPWILTNMNDDGGFVFRRNEKFVYGHEQMSTEQNESSIFATWFRTLSVAYIVHFLNIKNNFRLNNLPGYEFICKS